VKTRLRSTESDRVSQQSVVEIDLDAAARAEFFAALAVVKRVEEAALRAAALFDDAQRDEDEHLPSDITRVTYRVEGDTVIATVEYGVVG